MGRTATYQLLTFLCLLVYNCVEIAGDYRLEIKVEHYENPSHLLANNDCCYGYFSSTCAMNCHSQFLFCVSPFKEVEENDFCGPRNNYTTLARFRDGDDLLFEENEFIDEQNNVPNPLVFTVNGSWPGRFQFRTRITNWRYFYGTQLVDVIIEDWEMPLGLPFSQRQITGRSGHTLLIVSGRVQCINGLLCKNCTESCDKTQDNGVSDGDEEGDGGEDDNQEEGENEEGQEGNEEGDRGEDEGGEGGDDADETEPISSATPSTSNAATETEGPGNRAFLNTSSSESTGLLRDELAIGLSVAGIVVVSVLLAIVVLVAYGFVRKRMKHSKVHRSEQQPFLRHRQVGNIEHRVAATDDDSQDETVPAMDNPVYDGPSNIYSAPPAPLYAVPRKPRIPRTVHTENTSSGNTNSSADDQQDSTHTNEDYASQYAVITRHSRGSISPAQSLDDIPEASAEEEQEAEMAGYNVITQENMDVYVSEASASEDELGAEGVGGAEASQDHNHGLNSSGVTGDLSESSGHIAEEPPP